MTTDGQVCWAQWRRAHHRSCGHRHCPCRSAHPANLGLGDTSSPVSPAAAATTPYLMQLPRERGTANLRFITTVACGPADGNVETLRAFRVYYLETNAAGRGFISAYCRLSPPVAEFITDHPALKPIVRAALLPSIGVSETALRTGLAMKVASVAAMPAVSCSMVVWLQRKGVSGRMPCGCQSLRRASRSLSLNLRSRRGPNRYAFTTPILLHRLKVLGCTLRNSLASRIFSTPSVRTSAVMSSSASLPLDFTETPSLGRESQHCARPRAGMNIVSTSLV